MIKTYNRLVNQLLSTIYIDKQDPSVIRIQFDAVLKIFGDNDIVIPPKAYEQCLNKIVEERLVGKAQANEVAKFAIAQAMVNAALMLEISKEELKALKIKAENGTVNFIDKNSKINL